jgi:hypothetical protein
MQTDEIRLKIRGDGKGPFHSGNTALTRKNRRASLCLVIVDTESRIAHRFLLVNAVETCIFCTCKLSRQDFYAANRSQVNVMLKKQQSDRYYSKICDGDPAHDTPSESVRCVEVPSHSSATNPNWCRLPLRVLRTLQTEATTRKQNQKPG